MQPLLLADLSTSSSTVSNLFELAFSVLKRRGYRDEYVYKAALTQNVLLGKHNLRTASMVTEFRVGKCKADVVILNSTGTVYEIKSERDSLARLERQIAAYSKVFATVNVIASECHVAAITDLIPKDVGVLCLDRRGHITPQREAVERPERTCPAAIFDCLRTEEARRILIAQDIFIPQVPNTVINGVLKELWIESAHDRAATAETVPVFVLKRSPRYVICPLKRSPHSYS